MRPLGFAWFLIAFACSPALHAATVYKCVGAKGAIAFQDHPCTSSARQTTLHLPDEAPAPPPAPAIEEPQFETEAEAPIAQAPVAPQPPANPAPDFYLCTRYDGTRYMSDTGEGGSALVPLGVLGVPGRSLADAYSPQNSIGVSAPGLRQIPRVPAGSVPFGGMSTWIYDECHQAAPREACTYLRQSLDDVRYKLTKAFSDTTPELKRQETDILARMRGC
jgi:hypothetical protein